jgi:4-carboxymuconolactone decarboxylase
MHFGRRMRFTSPIPDTLNFDQRTLFDRIAKTRAKPTNEPLPGPFGPWLKVPHIGTHLCELGHSLRFESLFKRSVMEIGILVTARHWQSNFEWFAHAPMAIQAGVSEANVDTIYRGERPIFDDPNDQLAFDTAEELLTTRSLSDATFERLRSGLGEDGAVNFVALIGYYMGVSAMLNAFDIPVPEGTTPPFP